MLSSLTFLAGVIVVGALLALRLSRMVGPERARAINDSPWPWFVAFTGAAALALLAVGPKYELREERRLRMRESQEQVVVRAEREARGEPMAEPAADDLPRRFAALPQQTLWTLGGIIGALTLVSLAVWLRVRPRKPAEGPLTTDP